MRYVVSVIVAVLASLLLPSTATATNLAVVPAVPGVYAHDDGSRSDEITGATAERGPPVSTLSRTQTYSVVDLWSHGSSARPAAGTTYTYNPTPLFGQRDNAGTTTQEPAQLVDGDLSSHQRWHVAAKVSPGSVNKTGGTQNCVSCAIAGDSTLAGQPASAIKLNPDVPFPNGMALIEGYAGSTWRWSSGQAAIERELLAAGDGARGIVYGMRSSGTAHVFNAVVQRGQVNFVDFQTGGAGSFAGFSRYAFIRTN